MGRLPWREKWSVLGCWHGWRKILRLAALAMIPVLVGYFSLYGWLRVTGEVDVLSWERPDGDNKYEAILRFENKMGTKWLGVRGFKTYPGGGRPRYHTTMERVLGPAVMLEVALDRHGWSPLGKYVDRQN